MIHLKNIRIISFALLLLLSGCLSPDRAPGDFVQTTDFHLLQTYKVGEVHLSGMDWTESSGASLSQYTLFKLNAEMENRGFDRSETNADFIIRTEWKKALKVAFRQTDSFDNIPELRGYNRDEDRPRVMCSLVVELYDPKDDKIFWRSSIPDCVEILNLREAIISDVIEGALISFPERIELDPNLKTIQ